MPPNTGGASSSTGAVLVANEVHAEAEPIFSVEDEQRHQVLQRHAARRHRIEARKRWAHRKEPEPVCNNLLVARWVGWLFAFLLACFLACFLALPSRALPPRGGSALLPPGEGAGPKLPYSIESSLLPPPPQTQQSPAAPGRQGSAASGGGSRAKTPLFN